MLDGRHHSQGLDSLNVIDSRTGSKEGIFAHIFEIAAAERTSVHIDPRAQQDVHSTGPRILAQSNTHFIDCIFIPGGRGSDSADEKSAFGVISHALWAVCHSYFGNAETFYGPDMESVTITTEVIAFFLKRHFFHQFRSPGLVFRCDGLCR